MSNYFKPEELEILDLVERAENVENRIDELNSRIDNNEKYINETLKDELIKAYEDQKNKVLIAIILKY